MHLIGIVSRFYYNRDEQWILQTSNVVRKMMAAYDDCVCVTILPTENVNYSDEIDGKDNVNPNKLDYILDKCDAFILPGGSYAFRHDEYVLEYAIKHDKPLLGICCGFQSMCSYFAKNRTKFDMTERLDLERHAGPNTDYRHDVLITPNTKLFDIVGKDRIPVNSCHHNVVNFEMNDLIINAVSDDGIIEGVEYPNKKFIIGLQWHPESIIDENNKKIIDEFIKNM